MFDFIPLENYAYIHYNIILLFIFLTIFHTTLYTGFTEETFKFNKIFEFILFGYILLFMGLRPVSWYFGDMWNYSKTFDYFSIGWNVEITKDFIFYSIMNFFVEIESKTSFFFFIAFLYLLSIFIASKRLFENYSFFAFLILVSSFEFWSYGTNGIRNGLATSLIILAFTFMNKKWIMYLLFILAFSIHSSVLIPIGAYFVTILFKDKEKFYFKVWFICIFLSFFIGNQIENLITSLGILRDDVVNTYFNNKELYASSFSQTGFRWDFLIYSSLPVIISYYFIFKKDFKDEYYQRITNIYLVSNSVWILVIQASFSNRFAYLSWFMMGLVVIYPFLKQVFFNNQFKIIGFVILGYFSFTYLMNFILRVI